MNAIIAGQIVRTSSKYVAAWIQKQNAVKEESLTDWFLFDTAEKISCISYKAFSRHEESRGSGADWEWWVIFKNCSVKFRVQAKKLDPKKDNYRSLAYTPRNQSTLQIDRLIGDAQTTNSFPIYAFFVNNGKGTVCGNNVDDEGVYISCARTIYNAFIAIGKNKVSQKDIIGKSIPVSCLFLCPVNQHKNSHPMYGVLSHYFADGFDEGNIKLPGLYETPPAYIKEFIKETKSELSYEWEHEFRHNIEGICSLVVYDFRTNMCK